MDTVLTNNNDQYIRPGVANRAPLREKFVTIYEEFFQGLNPSANNPSFWDELFLLKVNASFLERCIMMTTEEHLSNLKTNITIIFTNCCLALKNTSQARRLHALETLCILLKSIFRKKFTNFGYDVLGLLTENDNHTQFKDLLTALQQILRSKDEKDEFQLLALHLLATIVTAMDNINQNSLIQFFLTPEMFDCFLYTIQSKPGTHQAFSSLFSVILIANYHKYEAKNLFLSRLSTISDPATLDSIISIIYGILSVSEAEFHRVLQAKTSYYKKFFNLLGNIIALPAENQTDEIPVNSGAGLLFMYELAYNNPTFIHLLFPPKNVQLRTAVVRSTIEICGLILTAAENFDVRRMSTGKMALLTILTFCQHQNFLEFSHSQNESMDIKIYLAKSGYAIAEKKPIVQTVLTIITEFLKSNLKKKLPVENFARALDIVHQILCFQKTQNISVKFPWENLWESLFTILKLISTDEMIQKPEVVILASKISKTFNMFLMFNQVLLPPAEYDNLYYEILRNQEIIHKFLATFERNFAENLRSDFGNLSKIVTHFGKQVSTFIHENPNASPDEVKLFIKKNYEGFTLGYTDNWGLPEKYLENPREVSFFRQFLRIVVFDYKSNVLHCNTITST
eukprot:TRINITY_DN10147_c0_g1_i3.p1 TRINITY_DN10147_c0_g1~~TRINITY_DN10147_c0_g1_i3.p1  ORF type:complete len:626 (-),score=189.17 TRINITY_DN10147_c0_g1_i3:8-1885(-)